MTTDAATQHPAADGAATRQSLTRGRVLAEAIALVDEHGLESLTMRGLATRLNVEAMSLYNHVPNKQALYDGIRGLLWEEFSDALDRGVDMGATWQDSLRTIARGLRTIARRHPHAFPLILGGSRLDEQMLGTMSRGLAMLDTGGFEPGLAAKTLNTIVHYALGYATMELSLRTASAVRMDGEGELETIVRLTRKLPSDTPPELVRVARDCCACDLDVQFEFGLSALLAGLDPRCDTHTTD